MALASAWVLHGLGPKETEQPPKLTLDFHRYMGDYSTELRPWAGKQGIVSTYWEVTVSNHGETTDSILKHQIRMYPTPTKGEIFYSGLDQGVFSTELLPLDLPLKIEAGHAVRFLVKVGILVESKIFELVQEKFAVGKVQSVESIHRYLYRKGMDVFGLPVVEEAKGVFAFPKIDEAPSILIEIETIKNGKITAKHSWYPNVADVL